MRQSTQPLGGDRGSGAGVRWRADWPQPGTALEREVHDLPHPESGVEWWWLRTHLSDGTDDLGLTCQFIRHTAPTAQGGTIDSHAVVWSLCHRGARWHRTESWLDQGTVDLTTAVLRADTVTDERVRRVLLDASIDSRLPRPDRKFSRPARWRHDELSLDFGGVAWLRREPGGALVAEADGEETGFRLRFTPTKPATFQHIIGGGAYARGKATYTYSVPRMDVSGTLHNGDREFVVDGQGWFEHAFGDPWYRPAEDQNMADTVWSWAGIQLDNGWEVAAIRLGTSCVADEPIEDHTSTAVLISPEGERVEAPALLRESAPWTSLATLNSYATTCDLEVPELELRLRAQVWFPQQEIRSLLVHSGFLEAHADVVGTMGGRAVRGNALWEIYPTNRVGDFERYISRVRHVTRQEIERLYPAAPNRESLASLAGTEDEPGRLDEALLHDLHASLAAPLRHATEGLGKGWRSYVAAAAIELFGVDSEPYRPLLAATELLHTGSLIIDDVQDGSLVRRGIPAAHTVFGQAAAINAATSAYFSADRVLRVILPDDDELRARVYQTYLRFLRAGHGGQAIDLAGHRTAMDAAVESGDADALLRRVRCGHRLKTAMTVRGLAEVGALIARADHEQVRAVGEYFEAVGLAYQISDDVADLRGLSAPGDGSARVATKHVAEDLRAGKVTMPLAHAVGLLPTAQTRELWHAVRDGKADDATVAQAAAALEECGAVSACTEEAHFLVEQAWKPVEDLIPCTWTSMMMRALGAYAARRERE